MLFFSCGATHVCLNIHDNNTTLHTYKNVKVTKALQVATKLKQTTNT